MLWIHSFNYAIFIHFMFSHTPSQKLFLLFCTAFRNKEEICGDALVATTCVLAQSFSCVRLFLTPWTVACQVPLSMGFPRQEYCSGLPFPTAGDLLDPWLETASPLSPALAGGFFYHCTTQTIKLLYTLNGTRKCVLLIFFHLFLLVGG